MMVQHGMTYINMLQTRKITVPEGWHEVTISQYQEIASLNIENPSQRIIEVISILINEDPELIRKMEITSLSSVIKLLAWTNEIPKDANYKPIIKIDDKEYGFISRLTDLTTGEWIDLEHYMTNPNANMHKIFSILYRPLITAFNDRDRLIEPYDGQKADVQAELFKQKVLIGDVYGALVFFSLIVKNSIQTIQDYLIQQMMDQTMNLEMSQQKTKKKGWLRMKKIERKLKNGIGSVIFTSWQKEMLQKWKQYLKPTLS